MRIIKGDSLKEAIDAFHQRGHCDSPSPPRGEGARRAVEGAGGTIASRDLELRNYSAASSMSATPSITPARAG